MRARDTRLPRWERAAHKTLHSRWKKDEIWLSFFSLHLQNHKLSMRLWLHKFLELCTFCGIFRVTTTSQMVELFTIAFGFVWMVMQYIVLVCRFIRSAEQCLVHQTHIQNGFKAKKRTASSSFKCVWLLQTIPSKSKSIHHAIACWVGVWEIEMF